MKKPNKVALATTTLVIGLAVTGLAKSHLAQDDRAAAVLVTPEVLNRALASSPSTALPNSEEIDFFEARRAARDGFDALAVRRIVRARLGRYQAYGRSSDLDRARELNDSLLAKAPFDPYLLSTQVSIALSRHQFGQALRSAFRAVEGASVTDGVAHRLRLFDALFAVGRYEEAQRTLDVISGRQSFQHIVRQARMADRLGDVDGALGLMNRALELTEAYAQPALVRAWNLVELGHFEYHSGNPQEAIGRYLAALETAPGYPAALEGLGAIAFGVDGDGEVAHTLLLQALANGGHPDLLAQLGDISEFMGRPAVASGYRDRMLDLVAGDADTERLLALPAALELADRGAFREAWALVTADLRERTTPETLASYAWVHHRMGREAVAASMFDKALEWGAPEPVVFYLAGTAAAERGDTRRARRLLGQAMGAAAELGPTKVAKIKALLS